MTCGRQAKAGGLVTEQHITVERYHLPRFTVELEPEQAWVSPGGVLEVGVSARYLWGPPVGGAQVSLRLELPEGATWEDGDGDGGGDGRTTASAILDGSGKARLRFSVDVAASGLPAGFGTYTPEEYTGTADGRPREGWGHSTYEVGAAIAGAAGVGRYVLFHHDPDQSDEVVREKERRARALFPRSVAAYEGLIVDAEPARR